MKVLKTKPKIRTQFNYFMPLDEGEKNDKPSVTVPDQSFTVLEILQRFAQGLPLEGQRVPVYDGEGTIHDYLEGVDPQTLDLTERHALRMEILSKVKELQKKQDIKKITDYENSIIEKYKRDLESAKSDKSEPFTTEE